MRLRPLLLSPLILPEEKPALQINLPFKLGSAGLNNPRVTDWAYQKRTAASTATDFNGRHLGGTIPPPASLDVFDKFGCCAASRPTAEFFP
ncbi:hypothetical protein EGR_06358 [Echinococcus granulosus]|uniref:Uncharacterized protein n=1 Tax=Echinococcus granulosus TaxID=6210 RepID=W6UYZ7_ECHGR|nr:hypothetical protein EGR_06358 [Echinococcus granulosus]EUB58809.1 hypothetical protein EGR_06358 [Echinococcus granulosus]